MLLTLVLACHTPPLTTALPVDTTIRYRAGDGLPALGKDIRVDRGLRAAAEALAAAATTPEARLSPAAVRGALELGHYPGAAHFVRVVAGKELPDALLDGIPADGSVDIGYAWRDFADGRRWWVLGWCVRRVKLDPLPSQVTPGRGVGVRVEGGEHPRLFVVAPSGHWQELRLVAKDTRWVDGLDERGDYRFEVVDGDRVELLWGIHVGEGVPPLAPLGVARPLENPVTAVEALYAKVDALRRTNGLRPLARFSTFEPIVREQAACLALGGVAAHDTEHCPGVPGRATQRYYPRGHFHEDVAVGDTTEEAWQTLLASPGHLANLLCVDCTHLSIGAAVEPVAEPRLFVVWEAMEFPNGEPRVIGDR